jgi:PIN domain nuclease of toxin-antitoxin system
MIYLLDTHALFWILKTPKKLPAGVLGIVEDHSTTLLVSIACPWELAIKTNRGRIDARRILDQMEQVIGSGGYQLLDTRISHVIAAGFLPLHHKDPFDRLLIAQALELRVPIISCDSTFDAYGVRRIWN